MKKDRRGGGEEGKKRGRRTKRERERERGGGAQAEKTDHSQWEYVPVQ